MMDFIAAELAFRDLDQKRQVGQIDMAEYRQQLMALRVTDDQERTWMMQELTGQWFVWEDAQWQVAVPPQPTTLPPPPAPSAPPAPPAPPVQQPAAPEPVTSQAVAPEDIAPQPVEPQPMTRRGLSSPVISSMAAESVPQQDTPLTLGTASRSVQQAPAASRSVQQAPAASQSVQQAPAVGQSVQQAPSSGYATLAPQVKHWRPSCLSVTLRLFFWALLWSIVAWAVSSLFRTMPLWAYLAVLLGALLHLVYAVRRMTRHGREARAKAKGGVR